MVEKENPTSASHNVLAKHLQVIHVIQWLCALSLAGMCAEISTLYSRRTVPNMAEHLLYEKLDQSRQEIRLLTLEPGERGHRIVCSLASASLAEPDIAYEALSYCWGSPNDERDISISGTVVQVTDNLFAALEYLRRPSERRILWVDAVCINQNDCDE